MIEPKGNLKELTIIEILIFIFEKDLTGLLTVSNGDIKKNLLFRKGRLIWANSNRNDERFDNILMSQNIVSDNLIEKVLEKIDNPENVGKFLLEKGLITLENLVEAAKKQIKMIILDIASWSGGTYEISTTLPPNDYINLDLMVAHFIIYYILRDLNEEHVFQKIGNLNIELILNSQESKIAKYNFSDKQQELLHKFTNSPTAESVLATYAPNHRPSIVKILYFFLISGLLEKKEAAASAPPPIEQPVTDIPEPPKPKKIEATQDIAHVLGEKIRDKDDISKYQDNTSSRKFFRDTIDDKKKNKLFNYILISIIIILILAGAIFLLIPPENNNGKIEPKKQKPVKTEEKIKIPVKEKPIEITMEKQVPKSNQNQKEEPPKNTTPEKTKEIIQPSKTEVQKTIPKENTKPSTVTGQKEDPIQYLNARNMVKSGDIWKREIIEGKYTYSILLEMDCMPESVLMAYENIAQKTNFFILNRKLDSRNCFLVMWGKFHNQQEASQSLSTIPSYFWKQQHPPIVVELAKYL